MSSYHMQENDPGNKMRELNNSTKTKIIQNIFSVILWCSGLIADSYKTKKRPTQGGNAESFCSSNFSPHDFQTPHSSISGIWIEILTEKI